MRHLPLAANWIERRFPSARWESRGPEGARARLPFGRADIELLDDAGTLCVSSALEDCRLDDDASLDEAVRERVARRDASPAVRDRVDLREDGRVIYARFFVDDDATDAEVEALLEVYVAWLESAG